MVGTSEAGVGVDATGSTGVRAKGETIFGVDATGQVVGVQAKGQIFGVQAEGTWGVAATGQLAGVAASSKGGPGLNAAVFAHGAAWGVQSIGSLFGVDGSTEGGHAGIIGTAVGKGNRKTVAVYAATEDNFVTALYTFSPNPTNLGPFGFAGNFQGAVNTSGPVHKSGGGFRIDHPLDPANKYLNHCFVESSEMKNVHDGIVELDEDGGATVPLPEWFEVLNSDFRYQLTPIGAPSPELHVKSEIENGRFVIAGGRARVKVCWQVTGVRKDPWGRTYQTSTEMEKAESERGYYRHPELYGLGQTSSVDWATHPRIGEVLRSRDTFTKELAEKGKMS